MTKADNQPCWCKCTICLTTDIQGTLQTQRTSRRHCEADDVKLGLPRGTTWERAPTATAGMPQHTDHYLNDDGFGDDDSSEEEAGWDFGMDCDVQVEGLAEPRGGSVSSEFRWLAEEQLGPDGYGMVFSSDSEFEEETDECYASTAESHFEQDSDSQSDCNSSLDFGQDPIENIADDPLFSSRHELFNGYAPEDGLLEDMERELPWAFDDHPAIRNAYLRVFLGVAFDGMTHRAASLMLDGYSNVFNASVAAGLDFPGADSFARTIRTVEKRLGVLTEGFIIYLILCPTCWATHHPHLLPLLDSPYCSNGDCSDTIYTTKRLSDGTEKRTPLLILPYVPPSRAIQRLCLRPGKVAQWQHWRQVGDEPGVRAPTTDRGFAAYTDSDRLLHDVTDAWGWRAIQAGLERRRNGAWEVRDVNVLEKAQQFVALPNGLVLQMNIDWFQAVKTGTHSTGALYITICNNPRTVRYLREETILVFVFPPTPGEPSLQQLNKPFDLFVRDLKALYNGMEFRVHGSPNVELFHAQLEADVSDLPASRKLNGLQGFTSIHFMSPACKATFYSLTDPEALKPAVCEERDPWRYLKYAFHTRDVNEEIAEEIHRRRGIRYSAIHELVNWAPGRSSLLDFMHLFFLCIIKHSTKSILYENGMLNSRAMGKMSDFFENLIWPCSIGRLPPSIARATGSIKADQWKSHSAIFFVALFIAWEINGKIPDRDAPPPAKGTKIERKMISQQKLVHTRCRAHLLAQNPDMPPDELPEFEDSKMDRSLRRHYDVVLNICAARRILSSHAISPTEIRRGCGSLNHSIQLLARMKAHLTPYFHLAIHLEDQFLRYGPSPGFGTYPYERNNGTLGRFNQNGHSGGEIEGTMMRGWWKTTFIQELISHLERLTRPLVKEDQDSVDLLKSYLHGGTSERRGTLQNYIDRIEAESNPDHIDFPRYHNIVQLRTLGYGYYSLLYEYLRHAWSVDLDLISNTTPATHQSQAAFFGDVKSYTHIWLAKRRYGAATSARGRSAQYAYIDGRTPVLIDYIFQASITHNTVHLTSTVAIVRKFKTSEITSRMEFPWSLRAVDLAVDVWDAGDLAQPEAVAISRLSGHFILAPVTVVQRNLWITVAFDHDKPEDDIDITDDCN